MLRIIQKLKNTSEVTEDDHNRVVEAFLEDVLNIKSLLYQNWNELNELIKNHSAKIVAILKEHHQQKIK